MTHSLANLESFLRSAEAGSFSAAARRLGLTPAAVSRNVAALEAGLGLRLFQRTTRRLTLTEAGERFVHAAAGPTAALQAAIAGMAGDGDMPAGVLKVSVSPGFGVSHILPLLPAFLARYPSIRPDWRFENRPVDLVAEGLDAAIGGGLALPTGVVTRRLGPAHLIAVAAPSWLAGRDLPSDPAGLTGQDAIVMRSPQTGRVRPWLMRDGRGSEMLAEPLARMVVDDPAAMVAAAILGLGVTMVVVSDALPHLASGALIRLLPGWFVDIGPISIYYANRTLLPGKTRVFVDFVTEAFRRDGLAERFSAIPTWQAPS